MKKKGLRATLRAVCFAAIALPSAAALAVPVDTELSLLIDVSTSVDDAEFNLQRQGYIDAFRDSDVVDAIESGALGSIAVNVVYWSSGGSQQVAVDWTQVMDTGSADAFATAIEGAGRPFDGNTGPGSAIAFADPLFDNNGFEGTRHVIDVSGDGVENTGVSTAGARDAFLAGGGTAINGIVIGGGASLLNFYQNNVQGGTGSFTLAVNNFADFGNAIDDKLIREISTDVPEPSALALLAIGAFGLGGVQMRRRRRQ